MPNQRKERMVLRRIYDLQEYPENEVEYIENKHPDFIISHADVKFGVEVTEYYQDNASGQYANKPGYFNNLIEGKEEPRKKDGVEVVELGVGLNNGPLHFQKWVWRPYRSANTRLDKLIFDIGKKVEKYHLSPQVPNLQYIDLIVHDAQGDLFGGTDGPVIKRHLIKVSSKQLAGMPYRKIFICEKHGIRDKVITFTHRADRQGRIKPERSTSGCLCSYQE
jgi:hypothetical protein